MITEAVPFPTKPDMAVYTAVVFDKHIPEYPARFATFSKAQVPLLWKLLKSTWAYHNLNRPDSSTVRDHVSFDESAIEND